MRRIILIISLLLGSPLAVLAANEVEVIDTVTLVLPSDSSTYTLRGKFDSLTINDASFSFAISNDTSFVEIVSPDKKKLDTSTTLPKTSSCLDTESLLRINFATGGASETVTITPSGTCGSSSGGGGIISSGGGGGGGGGTPAPATETVDKVALLKQQIAATQAAIAQKIAEKRVSTSAVFTKDLALGGRGDDIKRLQELLASDPEIYPDGLTTGYYGTLTANAVRNFQLKYEVIQNANDAGNGRVGPKTRAKLDEIFGQAAVTLPAAPAPATPAPAAPPAAAVPDAQKAALIASIQEQIKAIQAKLIQEQIKLIQEKVKALQQQY